MDKIPADLNKEEHEKMFYFLLGFLILPLLFFFIRTTVALVRNPTSISDGLAVLYVLLLTGVYYTSRAKDGYIWISKIENPKEHQRAADLGVTAFVFCLLKKSCH